MAMRLFTVRLAAAAILVSACGGGPTLSGVADIGRIITIDMRDFTFSPAIINLKPGERVTLSLKNVGTVEHELMAGQDAMVGKGYMKDWLAMARLEPTVSQDRAGHSGDGVRVLPRGSATLTLVVPPQIGEFEFGCFVEGHYESGMKGMFVVEAGSAPNAVPTVRTTATPRATVRPAATSHPTGSPMNDMEMEAH